MNYLILGSSGKIGKTISKNLIDLPFSGIVGLQFNKNKSIFSELGISPKLESWLSEFQVSQKRILSFKVDFSNIDEVRKFSRYLRLNFNKIDIVINLLSTFVESDINSDENVMKDIINVNFLNQSFFFRDIHEILTETFIIQFLDYCVFDPYSNKYFWYSVSRYCMFGFMKTLEKHLKKSNHKSKFLYVFPKTVEENSIEDISKVIFETIINKTEGEIIF